jgi:hypothetical protein
MVPEPANTQRILAGPRMVSSLRQPKDATMTSVNECDNVKWNALGLPPAGGAAHHRRRVHEPGNSTRGGNDWVMPALWALLASHEFLDHLRPAWGQPPMPTALGTEHGPGPQHRLDAVGSGQLAPQQPTRLDMLDELIQRVVIGRQLGQSDPVGQSSVQIGDHGANLAEYLYRLRPWQARRRPQQPITSGRCCRWR